MEVKVLDEIIQRYCSIADGMRPQMEKPNWLDGFTYATNGHIAIKAPDNLFDKLYDTNPRYPSIDSIIDKAQKNLNFNIQTSLLEYKLSLIPEVAVYRPCYKCEGEGKIECELCGHSSECDACEGTGRTDEVIGHEIDSNYPFRIGQAYFNTKYLNILLETLKALNSDCFTILSNPRQEANIITVKDVTILLMPLRKDKSDQDIVIELKEN